MQASLASSVTAFGSISSSGGNLYGSSEIRDVYGDHSYICMSRGGHLDPALSMEKPNYFISLKIKELI